jgi:hypothetical protein
LLRFNIISESSATIALACAVSFTVSPLKSASETFDGDIAARIAGAAFTCDDEDLSSIKQSLDGTAQGALSGWP